MGAGFYVGSTHPAALSTATGFFNYNCYEFFVVEEIAAEIAREVTHGVDGGPCVAGIIGEIGCSHPIQSTEIKVQYFLAQITE